MRMTRLGAVLLACAMPVLATPALAETVSVETATGPQDLPLAPQNVVAMDVAAIDTLSALGVPLAGVPEKLYVSYLDEVSAAATPIGTLFEPDYEALASLGPDLIIVGGRGSDKLEPLSRIATSIDMTLNGDAVLAEGRARIAAYGALFDRPAEAEALEAKLDASLAAARAAVQGKGKALIVMTNGAKISAFGPGSRFGWLHEVLDLPPALDHVDTDTHGQAISFEFIAETDPDWLLVVDRGAAIGDEGASAASTLDNPLVARSTAAQKGQILYLDAAPLYIAGGGAQSMIHTLDEVTAAFGAAAPAGE